MPELLIRRGTIVTAEGTRTADLAVEHGQITAVAPDLTGIAANGEIDAQGLCVFPGVIDTHVHFNEPGRAEWEGALTGSSALAAGGGTMFCDMPLNSTPCTLTAAEFDRKSDALARASITDFAIWGGLTPNSLDHMPDLAARGVMGFKAFMSDSGLPDFPRADDLTLYKGMQTAATLDLPVAVHAESEELTKAFAAECTGHTAQDFLRSRPVLAELEAISRAALIAEESGCRLHIVHVSSGRGVLLAAEARARGVDITVETCPHYLYFTEDDLLQLGAVAKCAPPLRAEAERDNLWRTLLLGHIDLIASDHSPCSPDLKQHEDFFAIWGGIAGVQSTLPVLLTAGYQQRGLPLADIARLTATAPAKRYRFANKGQLVPGYDANLCLVDLARDTTLQAADLHQRHALSPYTGRRFQGAIMRTIRRGETIYQDDRITARTTGQLQRPAHATTRTHA